MSMMSIQNSIAEINAEKVPVANGQLAAGATAESTDLSTLEDPILDSTPLLNGRTQSLLVLQADGDFAYRFSTVDGDDADPDVDVVVKAGDQEYVRPLAQTGRTWLSVIRAGSNDTTVKIFRSAAAK